MTKVDEEKKKLDTVEQRVVDKLSNKITEFENTHRTIDNRITEANRMSRFAFDLFTAVEMAVSGLNKRLDQGGGKIGGISGLARDR